MGKPLRFYQPELKLFARASALVVTIVAFAGPYQLATPEPIPALGREVFFLLDVSGSMRAEEGGGTRLSKAKLVIEKVIAESDIDVNGLIVFAGNAYLQCPLTRDKKVFRQMLQLASPSDFAHQGTDLRSALYLLAFYLQEENAASTGFARAAVLLSDGEDFGPGYTSLINRFQKTGLPIYTIAIGCEVGSLVEESNLQVRSKMNPKGLEQVAKQTGGISFVLGTPSQTAADIRQALNNLKISPLSGEMELAKFYLYPYLLLYALFALLLSQFLVPQTTHYISGIIEN
jgi:Ca-activated chloride channel family protein